MTHPHGLPPYPAPEELDHAAWFKATASNGGIGLRRSRAPRLLDRRP